MNSHLTTKNDNGILLQICTFLFIALSPIQDCFLQGTPMRSLGASPSLFPLCGIGLVAGARWLLSSELKVNVKLLFCLAYVSITAIYGFLIFGTSSHGENLFLKGTTIFVSLGVILFATFGVNYEPAPLLRAAIYSAFILL